MDLFISFNATKEEIQVLIDELRNRGYKVFDFLDGYILRTTAPYTVIKRLENKFPIIQSFADSSGRVKNDTKRKSKNSK
jgi:hypothetical protein